MISEAIHAMAVTVSSIAVGWLQAIGAVYAVSGQGAVRAGYT